MVSEKEIRESRAKRIELKVAGQFKVTLLRGLNRENVPIADPGCLELPEFQENQPVAQLGLIPNHFSTSPFGFGLVCWSLVQELKPHSKL